MPADVLTSTPPAPDLAALYHADGVAWLARMADLAAAGRAAELDLDNLAEELRLMGVSERSAVESRLWVLLVHLLKWHYQPGKRSGSWLSTVVEQRRALASTFRDSCTLFNHAAAEFAAVYASARRGAAAETGLPLAALPASCPFTLDAALTAALPDDPTALGDS